MKKISLLIALPLLLGGLLNGQVLADSQASLQFSAEISQKGQRGEVSSGRIFVGTDHMRTEMQQAGQQVIQIINNKTNTSWILYPSQHSYMEMQGRGTPQAQAKQGDVNPCQGLREAKCKNLGQESVNGREATKWEIQLSQQGKSYQSVQWLDKERGILLRQESSNGQRSELKMLGLEKLGNRTVEKWEMTVANGNQPAQRTYRWFDPELNLAVREEFPGGFVREMKNINVAPQDPGLFTLPAGYKKITPQQGRPAQR
ncbi:MAG: DUF4412 domain-containing protein [Candidatus Sedimenticola sp. 20ELBAFRAG]